MSQGTLPFPKAKPSTHTTAVLEGRVTMPLPPLARTATTPGVIVALGLGALLGLLHLPFPASWLTPLPLALVMLRIAEARTPRAAGWTAFWAGLGFWAMHLFWLPEAFSSVFPEAPWVVWLIFPLVWPGEAAFWGLLAWVSSLLARAPLARLGVLACALVVLEWLRALGPLAFPWGNFGYAMIDTPLAQVASLGGVYLISLMVTGLAASLAALAFTREWRPLAVMAVLWGMGFAYGLSRPAAPQATEPALLVQGNIDPRQKARNGLQGNLELHDRLSQEATRETLIVWPEATIFLDDASRATTAGSLIAGAYRYNPGPQNVVAAVRDRQVLGVTNKLKPVPFGEFFPFQAELKFIYDPIFRALNLPGISSASLNAHGQPLDLGGAKVGAFVCYDSIFPYAVRGLVRQGATVLAEPTNDAWFGGGSGNLQHFQMDRMRAIESDRYLLRTANTGITAMIDPRGRVLARLPQNQPGALSANYAQLKTVTPYVRLGDWAVFIAIVIGLGFAWVALPEHRS